MSTSTSVLFLVYVLLACLNSRRAASHSLVNHELLYFRSCLRLLPGFKVFVVPSCVRCFIQTQTQTQTQTIYWHVGKVNCQWPCTNI